MVWSCWYETWQKRSGSVYVQTVSRFDVHWQCSRNKQLIKMDKSNHFIRSGFCCASCPETANSISPVIFPAITDDGLLLPVIQVWTMRVTLCLVVVPVRIGWMSRFSLDLIWLAIARRSDDNCFCNGCQRILHFCFIEAIRMGNHTRWR